jgi:transcriptional regulator with XRE-family HTH domain
MAQSDSPNAERETDGEACELSECIRSARKDLGWTQQQVAYKVGITVRSVSGWERGKAIPHLDTLAALARALGQAPEQFVATAQSMAARRRAERVGQVAPRIEGALRELVQQIRVGS